MTGRWWLRRLVFRTYRSHPLIAQLYLGVVVALAIVLNLGRGGRLRAFWTGLQAHRPSFRLRWLVHLAGASVDARLHERLGWNHTYQALAYGGTAFMETGDLESAAACFSHATKIVPVNSFASMFVNRLLGCARFMQGRIDEARRQVSRAGAIRRVLLADFKDSDRFRYLAPDWFVAFGHVAMVDFYLKKRDLHWNAEAATVAVPALPEQFPGKTLWRQFADDVCSEQSLPFEARRDLTQEERSLLSDSFWEYDFGEEGCLIYTDAAAKIQQRWEKENRPPRMRLSAQQRRAAEELLRQLGVPAGAWFVTLHVREGGYHARWNRRYPSARDADVMSYLLAVRAITDRGGWVVRMGDPSMSRLPDLPQVADYAHSPFRCEFGDIALPVMSRFLLGTNSGFATVPGIYGTPNVLTNWVPVSLPLWFGQDLMIPKLFQDIRQGRLLTFEEMFASPLGTMQNIRDFPPHIAIRANTPEEIRDVALEMLERLEGASRYSAEDDELQERYTAVALRHGSYRGSRVGRAFLAQHRHLLATAAHSTIAADNVRAIA